MVFERKKLKSAKLKKPLILHIKWLLFDQFNIKRLIFWVYMDSCMCIVVVQISVQKCVCLNYNKVPTLLTVDTKIDQKRSKTIKNQRRREAHTILKYRQKHEKSKKDGPWTVLSTPLKKKLGYPCLTKRCVIFRQKPCFFMVLSFLDNF